MTSIAVLDPCVFWLAYHNDKACSEIEEIVERCVKWLQHSMGKGAGVLFSDRALQRLFSAGYFPTTPHFERVIEWYELEEVVSAKELASMVSKYLSSAQFVESECIVADALIDNIDYSHNVFSTITKAELLSIADEHICVVATNASIMEEVRFQYAFPRLDSNAVDVVIKGDLSLCEPTDVSDLLEEKIETTLRFVREPNDLLAGIAALSIWRSANEETGIAAAIEHAALEIVKESGGATIRRFVIGEGFLESLKWSKALGNGEFSSIVLTKCAQVIADSKNLKTKNFRISEDRNSDTLKRESDGASARRIQLLKRHEALRLMYWEHSDGKVEFANVGNKFELSIDGKR